MIDLTLLRECPQRVLALIKRKDPTFDGELLITLDERVRKITVEVEALRAEKNMLARQAQMGVSPELRQRSRDIGNLLKEKEEELKELTCQFREVYLRCPNPVLNDVPAGGKEANQVLRVIGTKPLFNFPHKNHVELGKKLGWLDFEAAAAITGTQFALYKADGVRLLYALTFFMLDNALKHGYTPVLPPYLVNEKSLEGAGNFPKFKDDVYAVERDCLYLVPTSEVSLTNLYRDTIFLEDELPIRMTSWTSCFRREAGGYGATERGLIRIHEFEKIELYTVCTPQESLRELDRMIACAETILHKLGLHYRVSLLAAQDCGFQAAKTYDIEVWLPGQGEYKEVSSASTCTDFQARRCSLRYRRRVGEKTWLVHTLNASALAVPRLMVALMETYQQQDGSIKVPDILTPFMIGCL